MQAKLPETIIVIAPPWLCAVCIRKPQALIHVRALTRAALRFNRCK
jgi:hypothetical protein